MLVVVSLGSAVTDELGSWRVGECGGGMEDELSETGSLPTDLTEV